MKIARKYLSVCLCLIVLMTGCTNIDDLQTNPNKYSEAQANLILTNLEIQAFNTVSLNNALATRYLTYVNNANPYQYYSWQRSTFDDYYHLKQAVLLEEEANKNNNKAHLALSLFFKSYFIVELTNKFGDVPYSQAIDETISSPVYDSQKSIFLQVLKDLQSASEMLSETNDSFTGDIIYGGDKLKWRKLINSYYLRVLLSLSNKSDDPEINVLSRFKNVVNNSGKYPIMTSNEDSGLLQYANIQDNRYPFHNSNELKTTYYMEESFIKTLQKLEDPRLFSFAEMKSESSNGNMYSFESYGGLYGSGKLDDNTKKAVEGKASRINVRFFDDPVNEPGVLMSYSELEFIIAEAISRGWISGDVQKHYKDGIRASMDFYSIEPSKIDSYLNSSKVQIIPGKELEIILTQKHISFFMNTGWQSFYEQRRTGFPKLNTDGGGILNDGRIPKRWMYPESEIVDNTKNLQDAIGKQSWSDDNINNEMWLLK